MPVIKENATCIGVNSNSVQISGENDDGNFNVGDIGFDFFYNGVNVRNSIYISGNTFVGFGSASEHLKINRVDAKVIECHREFTDDYTRFRWNGRAPYNSSTQLRWELFLYKDNSIMLIIDTTPQSGTDWFDTIGGDTLTGRFTTSKSYVFLPENTEQGKVWKIYYESRYEIGATKYLIQDGSEYKTFDIELNEWVSIPDSELSEETYLTYGIDKLPGIFTGILSVNPTLCYFKENDKFSEGVVELVITPPDQVITQKEDYIITSELNNVVLTHKTSGEGIVKLLVSVNNGVTWNAWNGTIWIVVDDTSIDEFRNRGTTASVINSLTTVNWNDLIGDSKLIRFKYLICRNNSTDIVEVTHIRLNYK